MFHTAYVYTLHSELPEAHKIADALLIYLRAAVYRASKGRYGTDKSIEIRDVARYSIDSNLSNIP